MVSKIFYRENFKRLNTITFIFLRVNKQLFFINSVTEYVNKCINYLTVEVSGYYLRPECGK